MSKTIKKMTGYKATDVNMQCRGFQFELGKWHECEDELIECENGFHFCEQPSGVWAYYCGGDVRVFKVEAEDVLDTPFQPGADYKRVARRIRLISEVEFDGHRNTGHGNTGDRNTGDGNTGYRNTGDRNTGDGNTGDGNTGHRNTGYGNTGDGNTGDGNATNYSAGYFCAIEPNVICFDVDTGLNRADFTAVHGSLAARLGDLLTQGDDIDFEPFAALPGITPEKLAALHDKMKTARLTHSDA